MLDGRSRRFMRSRLSDSVMANFPKAQHSRQIHIADRLTDTEDAALAELGQRLRSSSLFALLASYGGRDVSLSHLPFDRTLMAPDLCEMVGFWCLGETIETDRLARFFGFDVASTLTLLGICTEDEFGIRMAGKRLVVHLGALLFCDAPHAAHMAYYGADSAALGRMVVGARGRVLDLCAGVGAQSMLCAASADVVVAIELQSALEATFWMNAALNGVSDRVDFVAGSASDATPPGSFDLITCNPPLLPVPPDIGYPFVGDGGPDGLVMFRRLLPRCANLLNPGGVFRAVGTLLGTEQGPNLDVLDRLATDSLLDIHLVLPMRASVAGATPMLVGLARTVADGSLDRFNDALCSLIRHYSQMNSTHIYSFLLSATHGSGRTSSMTAYRRAVDFWHI